MTTKYRIIIDVEYTEPPPDYVSQLRKIAEREARFSFGSTAKVVSVSAAPLGAEGGASSYPLNGSGGIGHAPQLRQ